MQGEKEKQSLHLLGQCPDALSSLAKARGRESNPGLWLELSSASQDAH